MPPKPRPREGGAAPGGNPDGTTDAAALFDEAWRLRTVEHIARALAVRPSLNASAEFKALPRALKILAWEGPDDEEGKARAKESWCAEWARLFPDGGAGSEPRHAEPEPQPGPAPSAGGQADQRASTDHAVELQVADARHQADAESIRRLEQEREDTREESARLRRQMDQLQLDERRLRDAAENNQRELQRAEHEKVQLRLDHERNLGLAREERNDAVQRMETMQEQQPPAVAAGADNQSVQLLSAATITVYTKFGKCASGKDADSSAFQCELGLLGVQLYTAPDTFYRYERLFQWFQTKQRQELGAELGGDTVETLLVNRRTLQFLNETEFRERYQESLQEDRADKRVWQTSDHDELRAVFSAFCLAKQRDARSAPVNLSQQLPPEILRLSLADLGAVLGGCSQLGHEQLLLKSPECVVIDFVLRYQQGCSLRTEKSGVQHAELTGR